MAALVTEFALRYSAQRVKSLTRADDANASTSSSTKLAQAATDAEVEFEDLCGVDLDTDNVDHVRVACQIMETLLVEWGAGSSAEAEKLRTRTEKAAERLAKTRGGRNRVLPETSSEITPTVVQGVQRPAFDSSHFRDVRPNAPGSRGTDDPFAP